MKTIGILLTCLLSMSVFPATAGSVYKWTDENGVIHFGDQKPSNQRSENVDIRVAAPTSGKKQNQSPEEQVDKLNNANEQKSASQKASREAEARKKQMEANCKIAQDNLKTLNTYSRISIEENGKKRYLSPEEINTKRSEYQNIIEDTCHTSKEQTGNL